MTRLLSALLALLVAAGLVWGQAPALTLSTAQPGNLFAVGSRPQVAVKAAGPSCAWQLRDWLGGEVARGTAPLADGQGQVQLPALERGYYELAAQAGEAKVRLALGIITDHSGQTPPSGRINVDSASAWLVKGEQYETVAKMLRMMGVGWARERLSWGATEPERGKINWQQYDANARAYGKQGVRVYQIFHDTPGWTHGPGKDTKNPRDLRDVYRFARRLAEHYRGQVAAWEVWNEPDIGFWPDLSDTHAGLAKAAYLGFKSVDPSLPVLLGSWCRGLCPFDESLMAAGMADYFDLFNWHCYSPPPAYEGILGRYLELMGRYGCADRPVWLSECGVRVEASLPGGELTAEDERRQAEFIPRSFASSLAAGTDRHFFFVFPYYLENGVQFGALRQDLSPRPACVAIAVAGDLLNEAQYLGRYVPATAPEVTAFAFRNKSERLLVVWSEQPVTLELPVDAAQVRIADPVGRTRVEQTAGGSLRLAVGPLAQYVIGLGAGLDGALKGPVRAEGKLPRTAPSPVVVRAQAQLEAVDKAQDAYLIGTRPFGYTVETYNFGEGAAVEGTLRLALPEGWQAEPASVRVNVPPMGRATEHFTITPGTMTGELLRVTVTPQFTGARPAPSVSHFRYDVNQVEPTAARDLELNEAARWATNVSGNGTMTISGTPEGVRFDVEFTKPGDRWCYPTVSFVPAEDFSGFAGLSFEYRCGAPQGKMTVRPQLYETGGSGYLPNPLPVRSDWTRAALRFSDFAWGPFSPADPNAQFDPQAVSRLMVGLNTSEDNAWLEVRKVRVVKW